MNRRIVVSLRVMLAMAVIAVVSLMAGGNVSAQTAYEVKVSSGAHGRANEFPLNYSAEYDNGRKEDVSITAGGLYDRLSPVGVQSVRAIWWGGIRILIPVGQDILCFPRDPFGGCWCLCLKWIQVSWFPWQTKPIYIWYYDPCCR